MMIVVLLIFAWLACAAGAYLVLRRQWRKMGGTWTKNDRFFHLFFAALLGPAGLAMCGLEIALAWFDNQTDSDAEASW